MLPVSYFLCYVPRLPRIRTAAVTLADLVGQMAEDEPISAPLGVRALHLPHVIKNMPEERLGLTRARPGGYERGLFVRAAKPGKGLCLMGIGRKLERDLGKVVGPVATVEKRQLDPGVRLFEHRSLACEEPIHHPVKPRRSRREGHAEEILDALLKLRNEDGREHASDVWGAKRSC